MEFSKAKVFDHEGLLQQMNDHKAHLAAPAPQEQPADQQAWGSLREGACCYLFTYGLLSSLYILMKVT